MPLSSEHNKFLKKYRKALDSLQKEVVRSRKSEVKVKRVTANAATKVAK